MAYDPTKKIRLPMVKPPTIPREALRKIGFTDPRWVGREHIRIDPATRKKVWEKRFGSAKKAYCVCCEDRPIFWDDFVCGHRRAVTAGGTNVVSNLEPICHLCNSKMGTHDLVPWCRKRREEKIK
jgi:hypothetical protein